MRTSSRRIRQRAGHLEIYCERSSVWYWNLAGHVHQHHRTKIDPKTGKTVQNCRCIKICNPPKKK